MKELTLEQREANVLSIVKQALDQLRGESYQVRRRGVIFIATLLGHKLGPGHLRDQPWGVVGQCENCGQVSKTAITGDVIEGRATNTICPANREKMLGPMVLEGVLEE